MRGMTEKEQKDARFLGISRDNQKLIQTDN